MINNYLNYLNFINEKLQMFFEKQRPYIFCRQGCSLCCKNAQYFYSNIEIQYLSYGFNQLPEEKKEIILNNIKKLKKLQKSDSSSLLNCPSSVGDGQNCTNDPICGEKTAYNSPVKFIYECPFLINNECSIYEYRGIICRAFGLMTAYKDGDVRIPFCAFDNLNYSNVIDIESSKISPEKYKKSGIKEEPLAFNISYEYLTDNEFEQLFNFKFGEKKPLIDWFGYNEKDEQIKINF